MNSNDNSKDNNNYNNNYDNNMNNNNTKSACAGPMLFSAHANNMEDVHGDILLHGYADDHIIQKSFTKNNCT